MPRLPKNLFFIFLVPFFVTCGPNGRLVSLEQSSQSDADQSGDRSYNPYVDQFMWLAQQRGTVLSSAPIRYLFVDNVEQGGIAICRFINNGQMERIYISKSQWAVATVTKREMIIFHELGHCKLRRDHYDPASPGGQPSLMSGRASYPEDHYLQNREYFIRELFELAGKPMITRY